MNASVVSLKDLESVEWDAAIVGAGAAGAAVAVQLATHGRRVLLLESKAFPRDKVCGGCLNQRAWDALRQIIPRGSASSMVARIEAAGAVPVDRMFLNCLGREAEWSTPLMQAISRRTLDSLLVDAAVASGAVFCAETTAKVIDDPATEFRSLRLTQASGQVAVSSAAISSKSVASAGLVRARAVIVADGLGHSALGDLPGMASQVAKGSRVGLGAIVEDQSTAYASRMLTMAVGRTGYVGLTRIEGNRLNVAAAVDASAMKSQGPLAIVSSILLGCRLPIPDALSSIKWTGTLPLTRTSHKVTARRLFTIGDSASYVEPFTGEGMSWALQDAVQLSHLLKTSDLRDCDRITATWNAHWKNQLLGKQWVCRSLAGLLRHPQLASYSLVLARSVPWIPQWLIARASGVNRKHLNSGVA